MWETAGIDALVHAVLPLYYRTILPIVQVLPENLSLFVRYAKILCKHRYVNYIYQVGRHASSVCQTFADLGLFHHLPHNILAIPHRDRAIACFGWGFSPLLKFFRNFGVLPKGNPSLETAEGALGALYLM